MPRRPDLGAHTSGLRTAVFAVLNDMMTRHGGNALRLHIGDTYISPPPAAQFQAQGWEALAAGGLYRYSHPNGLAVLREALGSKLAERNALHGGADSVQITLGATGAIFSAVRALLDPGDEVILPSPFWPLARGIVLAAGGTPREVPLSHALYEDPSADPGAILEQALTGRTALLYLCTPNNPDGKILTRQQLERIADFARRNDLWVVSDEAYEEYVYDADREHISIGSLEGMADRTATVFTFSKTYAMSGVRLGYVHAPEPWLDAIRRMSTHAVYNPPESGQRCGLAAVERGGEWLTSSRAAYAEARGLAVTGLAAMGASFHRPDGGAYVFARIPAYDPGDGPWEFIERCVEAGVCLAPGEPFGEQFSGWFRLCYTAVPLAQLRQALDRLAGVYAGT